METLKFVEDFDFMVKTIDRIHPCPDLTATRKQLHAQKDRSRQEIEKCASVGEFWHAAQAYLVVLGDGHTNLQSPLQSDYRKAGFSTSLVDGQVQVTEIIDPGSCPEIEVGDIILGVNGRDVEHRLNQVLRSKPCDTIRSGRVRAAHDLLVFIGSDEESCEATISKADGSVLEAVVGLLEFNGVLQEHARIQRLLDHKECVTTSILSGAKAGYLRLRTCMDRSTIRQEWLGNLGLTVDDVPDMELACWAFFNKLKERTVQKVIIDIRGNTGGNSRVGATLLKYLTRKPIKSYRGDTKVSEETKKWFPGEAIGKVVTGTAGVRQFPYQSRLSDDQVKNLPVYKGRVCALVDSDVYSSAEWLAAELAANDLATLVGEPTGGGGARPGEQLSFQLPNTGLTLWVSCKLWVPPGGELIEQRGVYPHYWVKPTIEDIRVGRDRAMEFALGL